MSKLNRKSKHFRMDFEHIAFLEALAKKEGVTETGIVEQGIREMAERKFTAAEQKEIVAQKLKEILEL